MHQQRWCPPYPNEEIVCRFCLDQRTGIKDMSRELVYRYGKSDEKHADSRSYNPASDTNHYDFVNLLGTVTLGNKAGRNHPEETEYPVESRETCRSNSDTSHIARIWKATNHSGISDSDQRNG